MFEKFTDTAIKAMMLAHEEGHKLGHNFVGTEQILLGLIREGTGVAARALNSMGINLKDARVEVEMAIGRGSGFRAVEIPFTPRAKRLCELAWDEARVLDHDYIGTEHLLLGLIRVRDCVGLQVLENLGQDLDRVRHRVLELLSEELPRNSHPHSPPNTRFERFSEKAVKIIMFANEEARRLGHNLVGTEQILLGIIGEGSGIAASALKSMGVNLKDARVEVEKIIGRGSGFVAVEIPFTPRAKRVLELSWDEARQLGHNYIGTEHLLLGLIREGDGLGPRVLENLGLDMFQVRSKVMELLKELQVETSRSDSAPSHDAVPDTNQSTRDLASIQRLSRFSMFSDNAVKAHTVAQEETRKLGHSSAGTEAILLGLIATDSCKAGKALRAMGVNMDDARKEIETLIGRGSSIVAWVIPFTPRAERIVELSWDEARQLGHDFIGTEHLLLGLIREGEGGAARVLQNMNVDVSELKNKVISIMTTD